MKVTMKISAVMIAFGLNAVYAASPAGDYLVKIDAAKTSAFRMNMFQALPLGTQVTNLNLNGWQRIKIPTSKLRSFSVNALSKIPGVVHVQPNYKIRLLDQPGFAEIRAQITANTAQPPTADDDCPIPGLCGDKPAADNPEIPAPVSPSTGSDPLLNKQWGMLNIGAEKAWNKSKGRNNVVVAVIDTGVDYQHEDLVESLWRNPGESGTDAQGRNKATNGVDDDGNGYVDDQIGWDFVSNDNKPYDLASSLLDLIMGGGNPGHGTHCAGNVAARGFNGRGISGVAPNVSIMALRFLSEKGEGTTAGAVMAIAYALRNGAHITSNSWGSEGEDPNEDKDNKALSEAIQASQEKGVLFVAAAGNGHQGVGYDNDTDAKPAIPASYPHDIIVSVAAIGANDQLGAFSNWGPKSVDIGAPGVKIFSTTVGSKYSDTVLDLFGTAVTWDGTSMATPHVAGAAALYLSHNPNASWSQIKTALLQSATPITALSGKVVSNGKLNVAKLLGED